MKSKRFYLYYLFACIGVLLVSFYPLYMGVKVIRDMIVNGNVIKENYPKYIIPYTPICIGLLIGVLLIPLCYKLFRRFALLAGSTVSIAVFFITEILFEKKIVVATAEKVTVLEDWQMYLCYIPPDFYENTVITYKTQTPIDIIIGNYNPAFKLHFYVISIILVISILNCLYGFAKMVLFNDNKRLKPLIMQSVSSAVFAALCILACFTAFWRDGNLRVSPLSASLMALFFILLGMVGGIYVGSLTMEKPKTLSLYLPALVASALTLIMYIGEMILLHGNLYSFGNGFIFKSIPHIILAPIDILIILASGGLTALIFKAINNRHKIHEEGHP